LGGQNPSFFTNFPQSDTTSALTVTSYPLAVGMRTFPWDIFPPPTVLRLPQQRKHKVNQERKYINF